MHHGAGQHPTSRLGGAVLLVVPPGRASPPPPPRRIHCRHTHHRHRQLGVRVSHSGTTVDGPRPAAGTRNAHVGVYGGAVSRDE
jgi:hypothetical protein